MSTASKTPSKSFTLDDVLKKAAPVERIVKICVAGDLVGEYEALKEQHDTPGRPMARLGSVDTEAEARRARLVELEAEMAEATFDFRFRALSSKAWSDLIAEHPDPAGKLLFNQGTFEPAAIAATCVEPSGFDDAEKAAELLGSLARSQQNLLFDAAWEANMQAPKGLTYFTEFAAAQRSERS